MPGMTGVIRVGLGQTATLVVGTMVKSMLHESCYSSGTFSHESLGLQIGWVCHRGSFSDCLPVWNERKDVCLIFSGEEFGNQEPRNVRPENLKGENRHLSSVLSLYEEMGMAFVERLNGWFSGVLIDLRAEKVVLFNDRYGFNRIYIHESSADLYFSSEAKSLLSVLPEVRGLDPRSLAEFSSCGCALQNRTLFSGISLLPPASRWTFSKGQSLKKEVYFKKETWENQPCLKPEEFYEKLKGTFARVLPKYFQGDQPIGMSLTGGLDGRMIMAWADREAGSLPCYTFGGPYRDCTDVKVAQKVALVCHQPFQVIPVGDDFLAQFPFFAERSVYASDGAMDVSGSVELYVNRIAREIAPVRLTGNYGSEIVRSHVMFRPRALNERFYSPEMLELGQAAAATYAEEFNERRLSFIAFKQVPWHHRSRLSVEQTQLTLRSPYLDNEMVSLMFQAPGDWGTTDGCSLRLIADGNPALSRIPTDRGVLYRPVPVLTRSRNLYEEFTFRAEYAYDYGMPQWLAQLDHWFAPLHLERLFLGRHKFYHFRVWYRDKLSQYLKDVLLDPRTRSRSYLRGANLERLVNSHIAGVRNYTLEIHRVLSCELVQSQLIERNWSRPE